MKRDLGNFASLIAIQVANAALPLIVFPFALQATSPDHYSALVLSEAIALAVLAVTLYSFDIDAVPRVVGMDPRKHARELSSLFSCVLLARLLLLTIATAITTAFCKAFYPQLVFLLLSWLTLTLSHVLQSAWLFQGLERNTPIAVTTVISRLVSVTLVLILVRTPAQYTLIPLLVGVPALIGALTLLVHMSLTTRVRLCTVRPTEVLQLLRAGRTVFAANAAVILYRDTNVLLLDATGASSTAISIYSLAEKLTKSLQATARPLNQFFFPKAVRLLQPFTGPGRESLRRLFGLITPQFIWLSVMISAIGALTFLCRDALGTISPAQLHGPIATLMCMMIPAVFLGVFNFMTGSVGLTYLGDRRFLFNCVAFVGVINIPACLISCSILAEAGAGICYVFSEALLGALIVYRYVKPTATTGR